MKEKFKAFKEKVISWLITISIVLGFSVGLMLVLKFAFNIQVPVLSWWSATLLSDNYSRSIITEVESSGYNIRKVQSIDAFGRVCTNTFSNAGTSEDCDYPPIERVNWTIEDYRKLIKK